MVVGMAEIKEWLAIILAAVSGVAWLVRLEGRVNRNTEANQRTERHREYQRGRHRAFQHARATGSRRLRWATGLQRGQERSNVVGVTPTSAPLLPTRR